MRRKHRPAASLPIRENGRDGVCEAIAAYLERAWPGDVLPWTHFPAGELRDHVERTDQRTGQTYRYSPTGARLKRMGLHPGWWDFQFVLWNGQFAMAEAKAPDGKLTEEQEAHLERCRARGVAWAIWTSPEQAEDTCDRWLRAFPEGPQLRARLRDVRGAPWAGRTNGLNF